MTCNKRPLVLPKMDSIAIHSFIWFNFFFFDQSFLRRSKRFSTFLGVLFFVAFSLNAIKTFFEAMLNKESSPNEFASRNYLTREVRTSDKTVLYCSIIVCTERMKRWMKENQTLSQMCMQSTSLLFLNALTWFLILFLCVVCAHREESFSTEWRINSP